MSKQSIQSIRPLNKTTSMVVVTETMKRLLLFLACISVVNADDVALGPDGKPLFGHSSHGEVFDEGPRQAAVLLPGTGSVHFEITTKNAEAQKFFDQGLGQLHGFWYYEAERSFRQVAKLDPDCAMAYCGLAMANLNNEKRSADFIKEALKRKDKAGAREQAWIGVYTAFFNEAKKPDEGKRKALVKALEKLIFEYPDDIEAKALLVFHLWDNSQHGIPVTSHTAIAALAQQVQVKNPQHPGIHHYLIHLWNYEDDRRALTDASTLGQSAPGIAHMWHMPGHTFTRLHRWADAAWQQEASARTDHAHMIASRIMPEQIHNYAHNNDWLVENLGFIGRVHDALDLAKNMIELPRLAPGHVLIGKDDYPDARTGYAMGRKRLLDLLLSWERWEELLALDGTQYLEAFSDPVEEARRLRAIGVAAFQAGNKAKGEEKIAAVDALIKKLHETRYADAEKAESDAKKENKPADQVANAMTEVFKKNSDQLSKLESLRNEIRLYKAIAEEKSAEEIRTILADVKDIPPLRLARIQLTLVDDKKALELAEKAVKDGEQQVLPLATLASIQWVTGKQDEAKKTFEKLRPLCAQADISERVFTRLAPIISALDLPADWRPKLEWPADSGARPEISTLGPFRWHPYPAPAWSAMDANGKQHSLSDLKGKPHLLVFYLGSGCSHCIEQLNLLAPLAKEYTDAGITITAVSTDSAEDLQKTFAQAKDAEGFPFPIVSDHTLAAFHTYRAFDDFENTPLHGTFLVDAAGYVRWQDISYRPFRDVKWLLGESKRLLAMPVNIPAGVSAAK